MSERKIYECFDDIKEKIRADSIYLICQASRPGVRLFMVKTEWELFRPTEDMVRNDQMQLIIVNWQGLRWIVLGVPVDDLPDVSDIAAECGLRLVKGIPHMYCGDGLEPFPIGEQTQALSAENVEGHAVYRNDSKELERLEQLHTAEIDSIFKREGLQP